GALSRGSGGMGREIGRILCSSLVPVTFPRRMSSMQGMRPIDVTPDPARIFSHLSRGRHLPRQAETNATYFSLPRPSPGSLTLAEPVNEDEFHIVATTQRSRGRGGVLQEPIQFLQFLGGRLAAQRFAAEVCQAPGPFLCPLGAGLLL